MDITALRIITPMGNCFAVFPNDSISCELKGDNSEAIYFFENNLHKMTKEHGYPVVLSSIDPDEFATYCNRPDLNISIDDIVTEYDLAVI